MRRALVLMCGLVLAACSTGSSDDPQTDQTTTTSIADTAVATTTSPPTTAARAVEVSIVERPEWEAVFAAQDVAGTIAVHEIDSDHIDVYAPTRAAEPRIPASTFKILNSLIILETGALPSADELVTWDGVERQVEVWNQDHSLRSGIEVSAVWMYQQMAREVGEEQMSFWVSEAGYGNADIGGGIDQFWLSGDLRISPLEQIDFLTRMVEGGLPFSDETVAAVRDILVRESGDGWAWSHKTGTSLSSTPDLGWLVGIAENEDRTWVFALNVDLEPVVDVETQLNPRARQDIARTILEMEGALPAS